MKTEQTYKSIRGFLLLLLSCVLFCATAFFLIGCNKQGGGEITDQPSNELVDEDLVTEEIFHDQGDVFLSSFEPTDQDDVIVRLRVRRGNATNVTVEWTTELSKVDGKDIEWKSAPLAFEKADVNKYYDYYKGTIPAQPSAYRYHFVVQNNKQTAYYAGRDIELAQKDSSGKYVNPFSGFSKDFLLQVNFSTPDWSKGALWYSAMPDSFYNSDPTGDKYGGAISQSPWGTVHSGGLGYFGGDMQGLYDQIGYLQELNCTALFINPVWLANHNAGYGFFDGTLLDSTFGNEQMLKKLADELHDNDMRLMFDGVFNYFVGNSKYVNSSGLWPTERKGKENDYYKVFMRDGQGNLQTNQFGYVVDFASEDAQKLIYSSPDSIMQYYVTECGVDGWRLDSAILFVASDGRTGTQMIQDIRKYMKEVAPDSLLCLENANEAGMYTDYAADTYWNQRFLKAVEAFMDGKVNKSTLKLLSSNLYEAVLGLPRSVAHSSYNMLTNHDCDRILYLMDGDVQKAQALYLMVMTYMGSPTIFYGEETGTLDTDRFFVGMNWDRSTWNYEIFNLIKSLGQFRSENEGLFKYGTLRTLGVDEENLLLKYQRSYQGTSILTVLNPNGGVRKGVEIDVHTLEVKNGEKVYDYLSGNSYTVQDGKITIDVMPYGALLTNKGANSWAGKWQVFGEGGAVRQTNANELTVEGNGTFATLPIYNNAKLSFVAEGNVLAALRAGTESNAAYYGAEISGTQLVVKARESAGGAERTVATLALKAGQRVELVRSNDNTFYVTIDGAKQANSECYAELSYEGVAAIGGLNGEGKAKDVALTMNAEDNQRATQFDKATDSMTFYAGDTSKASIASGKLKLAASDEGVFALTHAQMRDFTVKAQMSGTPKQAGDLMGVAVYQAENNYIFAGRAYVDGAVKLVLGQSVNGQATLFAEAKDISGEIVVQLERLGAYWTARYKMPAQESFTLLAEGLCANFSDMNAGVFNLGKGEAVFEYYCFGDAVNDGHSLSAHAGYGNVNRSAAQSASYSIVTYKTEGGNWKMVQGGFLQSDETAVATALKTTQGSFKGFRADYSVAIYKAGQGGNVALRFGGNYSLRFEQSGKLELFEGNKSLGSHTVRNVSEQPLRIMAVMTDGGRLSVYAGTETELVFHTALTNYRGGEVYIEGSNASYKIADMQFQVYTVSHSLASATEFVATLKVTKIQQTNILNRAELGFAFGGSANGGVKNAYFAGISSRQEAYIAYNGEKLVSVNLGSSFKDVTVYLTLVVQDGKIMLFADSENAGTFSAKPIAEYDTKGACGGLVSVYGVNGRFEQSDFAVYGMTESESYETTAIFQNRKFA